MPFCQDCGAKLEAGVKFCMDCGAPVIDVAGTETSLPGSSDVPSLIAKPEKVILIIPNLMKVRGLFLKGPSWHHLVVTPERIIIVQRTVKGLDRLKENIGVIGPDHDHFFLKSMTPGQILAEYPDSQVIPIADLASITVLKFVSYSTEEGTEPYWQVQLATRSGVLTLRTDYHEDPGEYFRDPALNQILGNRLALQDM